MKRTALLLLHLFCFCTCRSQKEEKFVLALEAQSSLPKTALPFGALQILDARFDQLNVGCVAKDISFKGITERKMLAVFPENAKTYLPKILPSIVSFDKQSTDTLVLLLKQLRIADHFANTTDAWHDPETVLTLSCSFYAKAADRLTKLFSFDEALSEKWLTEGKPSQAAMAPLRTTAVLHLLSVVFRDRNWTPSTTSFSLQDAEAGIGKRLQLPVFTDRVLVPGLYKNFEEFKNNSPSVRGIRIGRQNETVKEIQDLNGNTIDPKSFWGVCDGEHRYLCFQQGIHRLYPVDNSFRLAFYRRDGEAGFKADPDKIFTATPAPVLPFPFQLNNTFSKYTRNEFFT